MIAKPPLRRILPPLALLLPLVILFAGTARAEILLHPQGWRFPNIVTAVKEAIRVSDRTPVIPGKETITKGYRKADGTYFMTYEIEGKVFGFEIDDDGKPPFEFSVMDTDGDGKFETKIIHDPDNKDRAYVPQWVIDYYFEVHPEMRDAPPDAKAPLPSLNPPTVTPRPVPDKPHAPSLPPPEVRERPNP